MGRHSERIQVASMATGAIIRKIYLAFIMIILLLGHFRVFNHRITSGENEKDCQNTTDRFKHSDSIPAHFRLADRELLLLLPELLLLELDELDRDERLPDELLTLERELLPCELLLRGV